MTDDPSTERTTSDRGAVRSGGRRIRWLIVGVSMAVCVAAGVVVLRSGPPSRSWAVDGVEELPSNRLRVDYGLPSPCEHVERLDIHESASEVAVTLRISDDGGDCTANVVFGSRTFRLERPLGQRRVVDRGCLERGSDRRCDDIEVKRR